MVVVAAAGWSDELLRRSAPRGPGRACRSRKTGTASLGESDVQPMSGRVRSGPERNPEDKRSRPLRSVGVAVPSIRLHATAGRTAPLAAGDAVAQGESVIKCPYPLNVLKDAYDHSCCLARSYEYQHVMADPPAAARAIPRRSASAAPSGSPSSARGSAFPTGVFR